MQISWNFFALLAKIPKIVVILLVLYVFIQICRSFFLRCFSVNGNSFFKNLYDFFDPYHQSVLFYRYRWFSFIIIIIATYLLCKTYIPAKMLSYEKGMYAAQSLLNNHLTYFINYLVHENLGHNMFCSFTPRWFCYFSGDFIQILFPCIIYFFALQLRGGLFFTPAILYWLSSAFYSAGIYSSDAAASKLALTSSDMVSDAAAGTVKGDWYYILAPFEALDYATTIGMILEIMACFVFVMAIYSFVEYIRRLSRTDITYEVNKSGE